MYIYVYVLQQCIACCLLLDGPGAARRGAWGRPPRGLGPPPWGPGPHAGGPGAPARPWATAAAAAVGPGGEGGGGGGKMLSKYIGLYASNIGCLCLEYRISMP